MGGWAFHVAGVFLGGALWALISCTGDTLSCHRCLSSTPPEWYYCEVVNHYKKGGGEMAKSGGSRGGGKGGHQGGSKSGSRGNGGRPSTTGNRSGGGRDNAPSRSK